MKKIFFLIFAILIVTTASTYYYNTYYKRYYAFDSSNDLVRPDNYREWVFAGSSATPLSNDPNALFPDLQFVYIDPVSFAYWREHGTFRDGTILVKEIAMVGATNSSVGKGFFTGNYRALSATVKDSKRFPDTPGNWGYFTFTDKQTGLLLYASPPRGEECTSCHLQNAPTGNVFTNYLSVLRDAQGAGAENPENLPTRKGLKKDS